MATSNQLISRRQQFRRALHAWYRAQARRLPWREAPSLYKTVVSEFMLQQTQVVTVLPYFDRWMRTLPDFTALAVAPEAQVMKLWEGLGYYSRARNLHRLAQAVIARPAPLRTPAEWCEVPGVGPYTSAAITSISFGEPVACVDGNVVRILARLTGEARRFRDGAEAAKLFTPLANVLIGRKNPGRHNQAMMELGAIVCLRKRPLCLICPVAKFCAAYRSGAPDKFPRLKPRRLERRNVARAWCERQGRLLLSRAHPKAKRLAGLYELPELVDLGVKPSESSLLVTKRRAITRFQITESIHRINPTITGLKRIARNDSLEWIPVAGLEGITLSGPHKRWIRELLKM